MGMGWGHLDIAEVETDSRGLEAGRSKGTGFQAWMRSCALTQHHPSTTRITPGRTVTFHVYPSNNFCFKDT